MILRTLLALALSAGAVHGQAGSAAFATLTSNDLLVLTDGWEQQPEEQVLNPDGSSIAWPRLGVGAEGWMPSLDTDKQRLSNEIRWYRTTITLDASMRSSDLGLFMELQGSAQLFIDGSLTNSFGRLDPVGDGLGSQAPALGFGHRYQSLPPLEPGPHELLVRYKAEHGSFAWMAPYLGFRLTLGRSNVVALEANRAARAGSLFQAFFVGAFVSQAILHLLLFIYLPRFRSNAWFSLNAALSSLLAGLHFERSLSDNSAVLSFATWIWNPLLFVTMMVLLRVTYEVYDRQRGRVFWALFALGTGLAIFVVLVPDVDAFGQFWWFHALILIEALRINWSAIRSGWRGSGLIGAGLVLLAASLIWQFLLVAGVVPQPFNLFPVAYTGVALFLLSVSAYLARKFAQLGETLGERAEEIERLSNDKLERELEAKERELESRLLEADNNRKTEELEAARALQLSLLPSELPNVDGLDIAVSMTTATEVGGDYYDFQVAPDGSLLVAIGDAAGHGASAGNMVAMMKGLFSTFSVDRGLANFFVEANKAIRSMKLPGANTAMAIAHLTPDALHFSAAGIPPVLVVRAETSAVEEVLVEGTPLGAFPDFPYKQKTVPLREGDVVLLMSDGLAELPDPSGEAFGYDRLKSLVQEAASGTAQELIERLRASAEDWFRGSPYPDDITLVVLKHRTE